MEFTVLEYCETQHLHDDMDLKLCTFCRKAMCQTCFDAHKIHCSGQTESNKRQCNNSTYSQGQPKMKKSRNTDALQQNETLKHSSPTTPELPLENDTRDAYPECKVHLLSEDRFCVTHCILVCQTCQTEHHASCTVKLVTEICDRLDHTAVTEYKKWLNNLRVGAIQIQTLLDRNLESEEKQKITSLNNLQSIFSKANENLNHAFLDAKSIIEKTFERDSSENWKKVSHLKDVKENLKCCLNNIRPLEGSKMEVSVFLKLADVISKYNNKAMPAELKNISENLRKVKYSFVPNNRYQPLSSQSRSYLARVNTNSTKLTLVNTAFTEDLSQIFSKHINAGRTCIRTMPEKYSLRNAHDLQTRLKTAESVNSVSETLKSDSLRKDFTAKATGQYALGYLNDRQNNQMDNESFAEEEHFELIQTGNGSDEKRDMLQKSFLTERRNKKKAEESMTRQLQQSTTLVKIQPSTRQNDHTGLFPSGCLVFVPCKPATAIADKKGVSLTDGTNVKESNLAADCSMNSSDCDSAFSNESVLITRKQLSASENTENDNCDNHKLQDSGESGVRIGQNTDKIFTDTGDSQNALAFKESVDGTISKETEPRVSKFQTNEHDNSESRQSADIADVVDISGLSNTTTESYTCNDAENFARSESITVPLFRQNEGQNYAAGATASLYKQSSQYPTYTCTNANHDTICKQQQHYTNHDNHTSQNFNFPKPSIKATEYPLEMRKENVNNNFGALLEVESSIALSSQTLRNFVPDNLQQNNDSCRNIVHPFHSKNRDAGETPSHAQSKSYRIPFSSDVVDNCFAQDLSQKTYRSNNDCDTTKHRDSTPSERIYSADIVGNDHRQQFSMLSNKTADYFKGNLSSHNDFYRLPLDVDIHIGNDNDATRLNNNLGNTSHLPDSSTSHMHVAINTKASTIMGDTTEMQRNKRVMFTGQTIKHVKQICIKQPSDKMVPYISGCDFLPDGRAILCDYENKKLKLLDQSFTVQDSLDLPSSPCDISVVNNTTAIITLPKKEQLQYIKVTPRLKLGRNIQLDKECRGVQVVDSDIYVTCRPDSPCYDGEVRILDKNGNLRRRLCVNTRDKTFRFSALDYLTVSKRSNRIYVSDWARNTVTCLGPEGAVIFQYKDPELTEPAGLCVDDEDNVVVCGYFSHNIHIVTSAGEKSSVILTDNYGIRYPRSVAYRRTDNTMIVGCTFNENLSVINFAEK